MIRATLTAATLAFPAAADVTIEHHDRHAAPFATITLHNRYDSRPRTLPLVFETAHGTVAIKHEVTWNGLPDPRDVLRIVELPPGVIAHPDVLHVHEQHWGEIKLFVWEGM